MLMARRSGKLARATGRGLLTGTPKGRCGPGSRGGIGRFVRLLSGTEHFGEDFDNVSCQNQVFAAGGQNLAERGFNPRTFGL